MNIQLIENWIQSQHLSTESIEKYHKTFTESKTSIVVFDNFLLPVKIELLNHYMTAEASYSVQCKTKKNKSRIPYEQWKKYHYDEQFYIHHEIDMINNNDPLSKNKATFVSFRCFLNSENFRSWMGKITGTEIFFNTNQINAKRYSYSDFLKPHGDKVGKRIVCCNLYLTKSWKDEYGGMFCYQPEDEDTAIRISPLYNRLVIFNPNKKNQHWIGKFSETAKEQLRYSISFWLDC